MPETTVQQLRERLQGETTDSQKLLRSPQDNPIVSVTVDRSIPAIVVIWKQYATSTQLRFIHEYLIAMLAQSGVRKILGDDTLLKAIHSADQKWITESWMPRAVSLGLRVIANKPPTTFFGRLSVSDVQSAAPPTIHIRSFDDIAAAKCWLTAFEP